MEDDVGATLFLIFVLLLVAACCCVPNPENLRAEKESARQDSGKKTVAYDDYSAVCTKNKDLANDNYWLQTTLSRVRAERNRTEEKLSEALMKIDTLTDRLRHMTEHAGDLHQSLEDCENELDGLRDAECVYTEVLRQNAFDGGTSSLLQYALWKRRITCAEILIDAGCEIHARSHRLRAPLHAAAARNLKTLCKKLIAKGANKNAKDEVSMTPLHFAAERDSIGAAKALVEAGAFLERRDNNGHTPLHTACQFGSYNVAKLLIENGCETQWVNQAGQLPHACFLESTVISVSKKNKLSSKMRRLFP